MHAHQPSIISFQLVIQFIQALQPISFLISLCKLKLGRSASCSCCSLMNANGGLTTCDRSTGDDGGALLCVL
ncbi:hypothetical protein GQ55_2G005100 [Panicum hallii var. hallii]|uniref:Uncharacterized protein n=1 Tax=Panicum hallii var. hallii TaxID=1504633 RepID=A0A2T7EK33_9POAL|nr:hypothetical protein GQ55_2G005100 [Panicum hallii var. hallii]